MQLNRVSTLTKILRYENAKPVHPTAPFIDTLYIVSVIAGVCYDIVYGVETTGGENHIMMYCLLVVSFLAPIIMFPK